MHAEASCGLSKNPKVAQLACVDWK